MEDYEENEDQYDRRTDAIERIGDALFDLSRNIAYVGMTILIAGTMTMCAASLK